MGSSSMSKKQSSSYRLHRFVCGQIPWSAESTTNQILHNFFDQFLYNHVLNIWTYVTEFTIHTRPLLCSLVKIFMQDSVQSVTDVVLWWWNTWNVLQLVPDLLNQLLSCWFLLQLMRPINPEPLQGTESDRIQLLKQDFICAIKQHPTPKSFFFWTRLVFLIIKEIILFCVGWLPLLPSGLQVIEVSEIHYGLPSCPL